MSPVACPYSSDCVGHPCLTVSTYTNSKDDTASVGTRASAAKDAVGDKINEEKVCSLYV